MEVVNQRRASSDSLPPWFSESIEEKKGMDTHQEILNYYPPSGETPVYDTISCVNVSPFPSFLGPDLPKTLLALVKISLWT